MYKLLACLISLSLFSCYQQKSSNTESLEYEVTRLNARIDSLVTVLALQTPQPPVSPTVTKKKGKRVQNQSQPVNTVLPPIVSTHLRQASLHLPIQAIVTERLRRALSAPEG